MRVLEAAYRTVHESAGGAIAVADGIGIGKQVLVNKVNPNNNSHHLGLEEAVKLMEFTGDIQILHALAQGFSGIFVPLASPPSASDNAVITDISEMSVKFGRLVQEVVEDAKDGEIIFDTILFAERERELNNILVEMGATKIRVANASAGKRNKRLENSVGISLKAIGGELSANSQQGAEQETVEVKHYALTGLAWHQGDRLDRSKYGWLNFEPEWQATVHAREVGQCQSAQIELYKRSSFHVETETSAKLRRHFLDVEIAAYRRESASQTDHKIIEIEFSPTLPPRKKQGWLSRLLG